MSLAVGSFAMIIKPPMVLGIQTVGTARRREGSRKNGETRGVACVAGVRKGRGRESGRETTRAQFPASPSPFNACHAGYSGRSARSSEDGRGGERKESLPTRFKFLLLFRPVPSHASAPLLPPLDWKEAETTTQSTWPLPRSWSSRLNVYIFCPRDFCGLCLSLHTLVDLFRCC